MQHAVDAAVEKFDGHDLAESGIGRKHVGNCFFQEICGFCGDVSDGALDVEGDGGFADRNGRQRGNEEGSASIVMTMRREIIPEEAVVEGATIAIYTDESGSFGRPFITEIGRAEDRDKLCKADVIRCPAEIREIALDEVGTICHQLF